MSSRWRYRVASVVGTGLVVALVVAIVNEPVIQDAFATVPLFGRPAPNVLDDGELLWAASTTVAVVLAAMWPLFKPRPRRILDTILETQRRVVLAMVGLAALGYFNYTYRLPRPTVMLSTIFLLVALPIYMVAIRRRPQTSSRAILIGDDPDTLRRVKLATNLPILGYVAPSSIGEETLAGGSDGAGLERLGGLSRIEEVIRSHDVDTVFLAFQSPDRAEFFGTMATCHEHGINAKIHRAHADTVLTAPAADGELVDIDLEPWDLQDRVVKRLFDVAFASVALLVAAPLMFGIAIAIKAGDGGSILYSQDRTAEFGDTFKVYKFRSMIENAEAAGGAQLSDEDAGDVDPRVTRVGRVLRKTHLDEIPQLWSILIGDMSVVGPRPERPELDEDFERMVGQWRRRWFVKPGLTGLAQIRGATGYDPVKKLRYDIEYIQRQSLWLDLKIVIRQLWQVGTDGVAFIRGEDHEPEARETEVALSDSTEGEKTYAPTKTDAGDDIEPGTEGDDADRESGGVDESPKPDPGEQPVDTND